LVAPNTAGRPVVRATRFALAHVPGLVLSGSKPRREVAHEGDALRERLRTHLRSYAEALAYPPNQVMLGNLAPEVLRGIERPWHRQPVADARDEGPGGRFVDAATFYAWLARGDSARLLRLADPPPPPLAAALAALGSDGPPRLAPDALAQAVREGAEPFELDGAPAGVLLPAHEEDESLAAPVLLENLAAKVSGALALRDLLDRGPDEPVDHLLGCGEEAVGDRYQRGGGNLAKAMGELAGLEGSGGTDVKSFCAGPVHALVLAGALVASGVARRVVVVGGGSLAKLGMKFRGHLDAGSPILEDVLAGVAIDVARDDGRSPVLRLDSATFHRLGSGSAAHQLAASLSRAPLRALGLGLSDVDRYAVELHDPDVTEPAGSGDVPATNYRVLAALAVQEGELAREDMPRFAEERGLPGFSPTQGHIASAIPYLPHAVAGLTTGAMRRVQLVAKGSLFLGRMTTEGDGASVLLERNPGLASEPKEASE